MPIPGNFWHKAVCEMGRQVSYEYLDVGQVLTYNKQTKQAAGA